MRSSFKLAWGISPICIYSLLTTYSGAYITDVVTDWLAFLRVPTYKPCLLVGYVTNQATFDRKVVHN